MSWGYLTHHSKKINYPCSKLAPAKSYSVHIVLLLLGLPSTICPSWLQEAAFFCTKAASASWVAARAYCFVSSNLILFKGRRAGRLFSLGHLSVKATRLLDWTLPVFSSWVKCFLILWSHLAHFLLFKH